MNKHLYKAAMLAALGLAVIPAAKAANNGDLFLGFNDAAGSLSAQNDYVIDLAPYTEFTTSASLTFSINPILFTAAYNTDGNALNEVAVGAVAGGQTATGNYLLQTGNLSGTPSVTHLIGSSAAAGTVEPGEYPSGGSPSDTTWSYEVAVSPTINDQSGTGVASSTANPLSYLTGGNATLNLYSDLTSGSGRSETAGAWSLLGTLTVDANSTGIGADTITFNGVNAVPEPASYCLYGVGGLLMLALRRRSSGKVA
jgi:hypothetical protein